jgi:4-hydroxybenzoate polyprenyltransferase
MNKFVPIFDLSSVFSVPGRVSGEYWLRSNMARLSRLMSYGVECMARLGLVLPAGAASAVSVVALAGTGRISTALAAAVFLLVYASYLIDHLADVDRFDDEQASKRSLALGRRKRFFSVLGAAALAAAVTITGIASSPAAMLLLVSFPIAVILYGTPWFGSLTRGLFRYRRLKDIPGFKAFYTAFFWGLLMVYADRFVGGNQPSLVPFFFGYTFLSFLLNTVYCDFKDLERDRFDGVATLPLMLGIPNTLRLLHVVNAAALAWLIAFVAASWVPVWTTGLALVHGYVSAVLRHGAKVMARGGLPGDAAIDAEFALWLPCALLGSWMTAFLGLA